MSIVLLDGENILRVNPAFLPVYNLQRIQHPCPSSPTTGRLFRHSACLLLLEARQASQISLVKSYRNRTET